MRTAALVLSFLPGAAVLLGYILVVGLSLLEGSSDTALFLLPLLFVAAFFSLLGLIAWRWPVTGGALFIMLGAFLLLFFFAQLLSELNPTVFLVVLPVCAYLILTGILNLKAGWAIEDRKGGGGPPRSS